MQGAQGRHRWRRVAANGHRWWRGAQTEGGILAKHGVGGDVEIRAGYLDGVAERLAERLGSGESQDVQRGILAVHRDGMPAVVEEGAYLVEHGSDLRAFKSHRLFAEF